MITVGLCFTCIVFTFCVIIVATVNDMAALTICARSVKPLCIAMHWQQSPAAVEEALSATLPDQCITLCGDLLPTLSFPPKDPTWHPMGASLETL